MDPPRGTQMVQPRRGRIKMMVFKSVAAVLSCSGRRKEKDKETLAAPLSSTSSGVFRSSKEEGRLSSQLNLHNPSCSKWLHFRSLTSPPSLLCSGFQNLLSPIVQKNC
ncbi:hypothetical protein glysoja_005479 [Glycine soja]|nr:hypothetical protein glysoja_005479 [Glycine soja]